MISTKATFTVSDAFVMPGPERGTPLALARVATKLADLAAALPAGTTDLDLDTLRVEVLEGGELIRVSVSTRARDVP